MEGSARMPLQPCPDLEMLVGSIVIHERMDQLAGWHRRLDRVQEADERLVRTLRFMLYEGALNTALFLASLQRLVHSARRKVFLIVDNLKMHHARPVQAWVAAHRGRRIAGGSSCFSCRLMRLSTTRTSS